MLKSIFICSALFAASPAFADIVRTPQCGRDLSRAQALIEAVSKRTYVQPPPAGAALCAALRANLRDMGEARGHMHRCMTGFEQRENVGQMDVSMADISEVLARRCR